RSDDLERNVLARSRLAGPAADGSRADALREVLTAAIQALSADPKEAKLHRVLDETFLRGTPTQEAAAAMLHLPFSPYRRYLAPGAWSWLVLRGLELHDQLGGHAAAVPYLNTLAFRPVPDLGRGRLAVRRPTGT